MLKSGYNQGVGFYRQAELQIISTLTKQSDWQGFLNKESSFLKKSAFEYDPENFLYFRARAISGGEKHGPNGNGDYFPWKELLASYDTFIGKGFYLDHKSDNIENAKGIILDAFPVEPDEYIECLVAVDRKLAPDVCRQIESGILNAVSMGCLAQSAECCICHNVAHNEAQLCDHMRPGHAAYVKGREYSGQVKADMKLWQDKTAFEINKQIIFTELSGVTTGADKGAHIFEIIAAELKEKVEQLLNHFKRYQALKQGVDMDKKTISEAKLKMLAEILNVFEEKQKGATSEEMIKALGALKEEIAGKLGTLDKQIEDFVIAKFDEILNDEDQGEGPIINEAIGTIDPAKAATTGDAAASVVVDPAGKTQAELDKDAISEEEVKNKEKEDKEKKVKKMKKEMPKLKSLIENIVRRIVKGEDIERLEKKETETGTELEIALGDGYVLKQCKDVPKLLAQLFDRDQATGVYIELLDPKGEMSEADKVVHYRKRLMLEVPAVQSELKEEAAMEQKNAHFKIDYEDAQSGSLRDNYFVASENGEEKRVKATYIIPLDIQKKIEAKELEDIISVEESIEQMTKECGGTMDGFRQFVKSAKREAFSRAAKELITSVNPAEMPAPPKKQFGKVTKSVNEAEEAADKKDIPGTSGGSAGKRVKDFYSRLPNAGPGGEDIVKAINPQSALLVEENKKIAADLKKSQDDLAAREAELNSLKQKETVRASSETIAMVLNEINQKLGIEVGKDRTKILVNALAQMDQDNLLKVKSFIGLLTDKEVNEIEIEEETGNLPQITASAEGSAGVEMVENLKDAMVAREKSKYVKK